MNQINQTIHQPLFVWYWVVCWSRNCFPHNCPKRTQINGMPCFNWAARSLSLIMAETQYGKTLKKSKRRQKKTMYTLLIGLIDWLPGSNDPIQLGNYVDGKICPTIHGYFFPVFYKSKRGQLIGVSCFVFVFCFQLSRFVNIDSKLILLRASERARMSECVSKKRTILLAHDRCLQMFKLFV